MGVSYSLNEPTDNEAAALHIAQDVHCPEVCSCGGGYPSSSQNLRKALFTSVQL